MKSPVELLKEELCTRYGLAPEQISLDVRVKDVPVDLAFQICKDYEEPDALIGATAGQHLAMAYAPEFKIYAHYKEDVN